MSDAPERIWLNDGGDYEAAKEAMMYAEGVTWCEHQIEDGDTEYVRADLIKGARRKALEEVADPKFLRPFVEEQSCGEWTDKTIDEDTKALSEHIRALINKEPADD